MRSPRSLLAVAAVLAPALLPAPASAATCTFDAAAGRVAVGFGGAGDVARLDRTAAGAIRVDGAPCGAATVANTDRIDATGGPGVQRLEIDLAGGPLAPGRTAEPGTGSLPEIEIAVDALTGGEFPLGDQLRVLGTAGADLLRFAGTSVLLNADADADVTTTSVEALSAAGGAGADRLLGGESVLPLTLEGGEGDDELAGGTNDDTLAGGSGNDTEAGNDGTDRFQQGSAPDGRDVLDGGGSPYDHIDYSRRAAAVRIDLDGAADDGAAGELDDVRDTFEYADGGAGDDVILASRARYQPFHLTGNGGADTITGGTSYDYLYGGEGADALSGGAGSDSFFGGPGDDRMSGGDGGDVFGDNETRGPDGADDMRGGTGVDRFFAPGRDDALTVKLADNLPNDGAAGERDNVRSDIEQVTTGRGADTVTGTSAANVFESGYGDDTLDGAGGNDELYARGGADELAGGTGADLLFAHDDADAADGGAGTDQVWGGHGDDRLQGGTGADRVVGEYGADVLTEPAAADGADLLDAGDGADHVVYAARSAGVTIALDDAAGDGAPGEGDDVRGAETLTGGAGADRLTGSAADEKLEGGAGDDVLTGGDGRDHLLGADGTDELRGGDGPDRLEGGAGADAMLGEAGVDFADYRGTTGAVTVTLNGQPDDGAPGEGDDVRTDDVAGGPGADRLTGDGENNFLDGGTGDDLLDGAGGADLLAGAGGNDTVSYAGRTGRVAVSLDGVARDGSEAHGDTLAEENDNVTATTENIVGGRGNDHLTGSGGTNTLSGGPGDDRLVGGTGADVLDGQDGTRDVADYGWSRAPNTVSLNGLADDGEIGEGDLVTDTIEVVQGGQNTDRLIGGPRADELLGGYGDDVLSGGRAAAGQTDGADRLAGGPGEDTATYADRGDGDGVFVTLDGVANDGRRTGGENDDVEADVERLAGGAGDDDLRGTDGANALDGGPGRDVVYARGGDDRLDGGPDPAEPGRDGDDLFGGDGRDVADYSRRTAGVRITLDQIPNDGLPAAEGRAAEGDNVHADIEQVTGGAGGDSLTGSAADDDLRGGDGGDSLSGGDGADTLHGGAGNNGIAGGNGDDRLVETPERAGNDIFRGGGGRDTVDYGARTVRVNLDNDGTVLGDDGEDADGNMVAEEKDRIGTDVEVMRGGHGGDRLLSRRVHETGCGVVLDGGAGNDRMYGSDGREKLLGGPGNDLMYGFKGEDDLVGGPGDDNENGGHGTDLFVQGEMRDPCDFRTITNIDGGDGADRLAGNEDTDTVDYARHASTPVEVRFDELAGDGADRGDEGDNLVTVEQVWGGDGNDLLVGDGRRNLFSGDGGDDQLAGGGGDDVFNTGPGADTALGQAGDDTFHSDDGDNADTLDGGADDDGGEWDAGDTRTNIP